MYENDRHEHQFLPTTVNVCWFDNLGLSRIIKQKYIIEDDLYFHINFVSHFCLNVPLVQVLQFM